MEKVVKKVRQEVLYNKKARNHRIFYKNKIFSTSFILKQI